MAQKRQSEKISKSDFEFVPALDTRILLKTAAITFAIGLVGFIILFWYLGTH